MEFILSEVFFFMELINLGQIVFISLTQQKGEIKYTKYTTIVLLLQADDGIDS